MNINIKIINNNQIFESKIFNNSNKLSLNSGKVFNKTTLFPIL